MCIRDRLCRGSGHVIQADVTVDRMAVTVTLHYWVLCISALSGHPEPQEADIKFPALSQQADIEFRETVRQDELLLCLDVVNQGDEAVAYI